MPSLLSLGIDNNLIKKLFLANPPIKTGLFKKYFFIVEGLLERDINELTKQTGISIDV